MKKVLYGTTALLAAAMITSTANAAEPLKLQLGGFMDWYVVAADNDGEFLSDYEVQANDFDVMGNGEIHFMGETMLDNGIKVALQVELEAGTGDEGDIIDESYVTVDTAYGRVIIGATNSVAVQMHASAPEVGRLGLNESDITNFVLAPAAVARLNSTALNADGDANKLSYITPTYYGVTGGVSWIPGPTATATAVPAAATTGASGVAGSENNIQQSDFEEGYAFSLMYADEFEGVGVTLTSAYANYNVGGKEHRDEYSVGTNVTYMGFTLGGAFRHVNAPTMNRGDGLADADETASLTSVLNDKNNVAILSNALVDGYAWDLGVSYETGPYAVSLAYQKSEVEGTHAGLLPVATDQTVNEDEVEIYMLSGKYNLGAGVDTFATVGYVNYEDELKRSGHADFATNDNDGWVFATGIALAF